eukprot:1159091-Pelagomonas_calceolata.AAC.1
MDLATLLMRAQPDPTPGHAQACKLESAQPCAHLVLEAPVICARAAEPCLHLVSDAHTAGCSHHL